jgi:hypothetical protein
MLARILMHESSRHAPLSSSPGNHGVAPVLLGAGQPPSPRPGGGLAPAAALLLLALIAVVVYRPDVARPFDIRDFSEFLPIMAQGQSALERFDALATYYAGHGRANLLQYAAIVLKWEVFGSWTPGWQWSRALVMAAVIVVCYLLLRRVGATRAGAAAGAAVFLVAPPAAEGWVRLAMAEPVATLLVLGLSLRALDFHRTGSWRREVVLQAAGAGAVLLLKEVLAPIVMVPIGLALFHRGGEAHARRGWLSRRNVALLIALGAVFLATFLLVLLVFLHRSGTAYASPYGSAWQHLDALPAIWLVSLLPFEPAPSRMNAGWALASVAFLMVVALGWRAAFAEPPAPIASRHRLRLLFAGSLIVPVFGALVYLPWPAYQSFYTLPYLTAGAIVFGMALSALQRALPRSAMVAVVAAGLVLLYGLSGAQVHAARSHAVQHATEAALVAVHRQQGSLDSVFVAAPGSAVTVWEGLPGALHRHGASTGRPWPPTFRVDCPRPDAAPAIARRTALVVFSTRCPGFTAARPVVLRVFRYFDWSRMRVAEDSVRVDVVRGEE